MNFNLANFASYDNVPGPMLRIRCAHADGTIFILINISKF